MKLNLRTNWGWYAAVLAVIGPFILVLLIDPDWLARVVGLSLLFAGLSTIGFWLALGPQKNLGVDGRVMWPEYIIKVYGDNVYLGTRLLILVLTVALVYFFTIPIAQDVIVTATRGGPESKVSTVVEIKSTLFIFQQISINDEPLVSGAETLYAWYFVPRQILANRTYVFQFLPNSRIVVGATMQE
ncbi:MAG: hypothetical protein AAB573_02270 [Patescibacteria group bacterium]